MVELNHTIVHARDEQASAAFLAGVLGLPAPVKSGDFTPVRLDNGVTMDYLTVQGTIVPQHYAYLVTEPEFRRGDGPDPGARAALLRRPAAPAAGAD